MQTFFTEKKKQSSCLSACKDCVTYFLSLWDKDRLGGGVLFYFYSWPTLSGSLAVAKCPDVVSELAFELANALESFSERRKVRYSYSVVGRRSKW